MRVMGLAWLSVLLVACSATGGRGGGGGGGGFGGCASAGSTCKANADCCDALSCVNGACTNVPGGCKDLNRICLADKDCCSPLSCVNSFCVPAPDGGGGGGTPDGGAQSSDCADSAKWVYVLGTDDQLAAFHPDTLSFTDIGVIACPSQPGATPYGMTIDRDGSAWVNFSSGELFHVNTQTAACTGTKFVSSNGFEAFALSFSANVAQGPDQTLFIAGGPAAQIGAGGATLGTLDLNTMRISNVGGLGGWPELSGNGNAELWAFFPDAVSPRVAKLDKATGAETKSFPLATLAGQPQAWTFASWGGYFWIFLQRNVDASTRVYKLDPGTGTVSTVIANSGRMIVGSGVSTCAPITIM